MLEIYDQHYQNICIIHELKMRLYPAPVTCIIVIAATLNSLKKPVALHIPLYHDGWSFCFLLILSHPIYILWVDGSFFYFSLSSSNHILIFTNKYYNHDACNSSKLSLSVSCALLCGSSRRCLIGSHADKGRCHVGKLLWGNFRINMESCLRADGLHIVCMSYSFKMI